MGAGAEAGSEAVLSSVHLFCFRILNPVSAQPDQVTNAETGHPKTEPGEKHVRPLHCILFKVEEWVAFAVREV